jgi:hypothetical protein
MASTTPATRILNGYPVRNGDDTDPGPTAYANELLGGHHQVDTLAQRDAIPAQRRKIGMTCRVAETGITYVLEGGITNEYWVDVLTPANARIDDLDDGLTTKASRDLADAVSEAVGTRLIGTGAVTLEKLDTALRSSIGSGLDATLLQGYWDAATNTPTIPAASGNNGKWYYVNVAGVATGNAPGTYLVGDRIVSNGTSWLQLKVPATIVADGSLSKKAMTDNIVRDDATLANGAVIVKCWATEDGTESIATLDDRGKFWPDPEASSKARLDAVEPKTAKLGEGLLPLDWVEGTEIWEEGAWILDEGEHVQLIRARLTEDGLEVIEGVTADGTRYPLISGGGGGGGGGYTPADLVVFGQDDGGVGISDADGERSIITETAPWKDLHPTDSENVWQGRSSRLGGGYGLHKVYINSGATIPAKKTILYGIGGNGQSLMGGGSGVPLLTSIALHPANNLMFNGGLGVGTNSATINPANMASLVAMYQTLSSGNSYETPLPGFMNRLQSKLYAATGGRVRLVCDNRAHGGKAYVDIKQGTTPYNNGLYAAGRAKAIAAANGWDYIYLGSLMIHGEQDTVNLTSTATYDGYLKEMVANESADYKAISGQTGDTMLFVDGCHSFSAYGKTTPLIALAQLSAALTHPRIRMVCPKYIFPYVDGIHMTGYGYRRLGEYHAEAQYAVYFGGGVWNAFAPYELGQTSDTVWAKFRTPLGHALRFDTTLVSDPTAGRYGFECVGASLSGTPVIDGDRVVISKTGTATQLRYAYTGISGQWAGPTTGARGCLRDNSPAVSDFDDTPLYNYCNTFSETVPPAP